jgi:hypothetical protein
LEILQAELAELTLAVSKLNEAQMTVTSGAEEEDLLSSRSDMLGAMLAQCSDMYTDATSREEVEEAIGKVEQLLRGFHQRLAEIEAAAAAAATTTTDAADAADVVVDGGGGGHGGAESGGSGSGIAVVTAAASDAADKVNDGGAVIDAALKGCDGTEAEA